MPRGMYDRSKTKAQRLQEKLAKMNGKKGKGTRHRRSAVDAGVAEAEKFITAPKKTEHGGVNKVATFIGDAGLIQKLRTFQNLVMGFLGVQNPGPTVVAAIERTMHRIEHLSEALHPLNPVVEKLTEVIEKVAAEEPKKAAKKAAVAASAAFTPPTPPPVAPQAFNPPLPPPNA